MRWPGLVRWPALGVGGFGPVRSDCGVGGRARVMAAIGWCEGWVGVVLGGCAHSLVAIAAIVSRIKSGLGCAATVSEFSL